MTSATTTQAARSAARARRRDAVERRLPGALAGDRHVEAPAHPVALQHEHGERGDEQHERQRRAAAQVEEAGDLQVRLRRQHRKLVAGEDQRRREVGERRGEQQQERIGEPGDAQRQRHRAEDAPARCAERERHALDVGIDAGDQRPQRQVRDREIGEHLGEQRAGQPVDGDALEAEQLVGDEAARPEREDHRDRRRERRRDERQQHARVDRGEESPRGSRPRAAVNANRKPSTVPARPTSAASSRLFQNARTWCRSVSTVAMPAVEKVPWSNSTRPSSIASG